MTGAVEGRCLCGAVAFRVTLDRAEATACHCGQCRAWSGHYWASVNVALDSLVFTAGAPSWFRSSPYARRGFCSACGSALFWHADGLADHAHRIAVGAGALAMPTGARLAEHIFVADKGDYYTLDDGLPAKDQY